MYNRVFQALQRGDSTWVFVMNIMVPGPPNLSFVAYWDADRVRKKSLYLSTYSF